MRTEIDSKHVKRAFFCQSYPIREALTRLSANGLVTYYSNCGVKVSEFSDSEIREIFQFMGELDALSIQLCKNTFTQVPLLYELAENLEWGRTRNIEVFPADGRKGNMNGGRLG